MRALRLLVVSLALLAFLPSPTPTAASPGGVAAYGHIWITNTGTGVVPTTSYDPLLWDCVASVSPLVTPTVTCTPTGRPPVGHWECITMILRAQTFAPAGAARGQVSCDGIASLTTADVGPGAGFDQAIAGLGDVVAIKCQAFGINGTAVPVPPYEVECYEPGVEGVTDRVFPVPVV